MAKRSPHHKPARPSIPLWAIIVGVAAVLGAGGVLASTRSTASGVTRLSPQQYISQFATAARPHLLLDVRTPEEFASGHIPGAVNISLQTLQSRLGSIPSDQPVVIYCRSGNRSATAAQLLADAGYQNIYDMGGILAWQSAGLPIE